MSNRVVKSFDAAELNERLGVMAFMLRTPASATNRIDPNETQNDPAESLLRGNGAQWIDEEFSRLRSDTQHNVTGIGELFLEVKKPSFICLKASREIEREIKAYRERHAARAAEIAKSKRRIDARSASGVTSSARSRLTRDSIALGLVQAALSILALAQAAHSDGLSAIVTISLGISATNQLSAYLTARMLSQRVARRGEKRITRLLKTMFGWLLLPGVLALNTGVALLHKHAGIEGLWHALRHGHFKLHFDHTDIWTALIVLLGVLTYGYLVYRWHSSIVEDHELALNLLLEQDEADRHQSYDAVCAIWTQAEAALDQDEQDQGEDVRLASEALSAAAMRAAEFADLQNRIRIAHETAASIYRAGREHAYPRAETLPQHVTGKPSFSDLTRSFTELDGAAAQVTKLHRDFVVLRRNVSRAKVQIQELLATFDSDPATLPQAAE